MKPEDMHNQSRWTRTNLTKTIILVAILLIILQYLVNVAIFRRNDSIIFLKLLDSPVTKTLNQTGVTLNESMRDTVTKMEKQVAPLELCPIIPPKLKGHIKVSVQVPAWAYIEQQNAMLSPGGRYKPPGCQARHRVAIVVPYRDREIHLKIFLKNIHPFLQSQQLDYGVFVVEMAKNITFNRALLMNVGFVEAMKQYDYQCFVFHDVDLLPEDDRNLYTCPQFPRHMSVAIDRMKYKLPYTQIFGGVSALTVEQFKIINGFSNIFFGWGGEDDDMYRRILYRNLTVIRYSPEVARYKMLVHAKESGNSERHMLLRTVKARQSTDGLTSMNYKIEKIEFKTLYTWILVSVNETEILDAEPIHKLAAMNLKRINNAKKVNVDKKLPDKPAPINVVQLQVKNQAHQQKVVQPGNIKQINERKIVRPDDRHVNPGKIGQVLNKQQIDQGKVVLAENISPAQNKDLGKQIIANGNQGKDNANKNNKIVVKSLDQNAQVKTDISGKANSEPKKPLNANAPKIKLVKGLANRKSITFVSWIPTEFKGTLPTNLSRLVPLPRMTPEQPAKKKVVNQKRKILPKQKIVQIAKVNPVKSVKTNENTKSGPEMKLPQLPEQKIVEISKANTVKSVNTYANTNSNPQMKLTQLPVQISNANTVKNVNTYANTNSNPQMNLPQLPVQISKANTIENVQTFENSNINPEMQLPQLTNIGETIGSETVDIQSPYVNGNDQVSADVLSLRNTLLNEVAKRIDQQIHGTNAKR